MGSFGRGINRQALEKRSNNSDYGGEDDWSLGKSVTKSMEIWTMFVEEMVRGWSKPAVADVGFGDVAKCHI